MTTPLRFVVEPGPATSITGHATTYNDAARWLRDLDVTYPCDLTPAMRSTLRALRPSRYPRTPITRRPT